MLACIAANFTHCYIPNMSFVALSKPLTRSKQTQVRHTLWSGTASAKPSSSRAHLFGPIVAKSLWVCAYVKTRLSIHRHDNASGCTCVVQDQWKPGHLHWEGIDQMVMQAAPAPLDALAPSPSPSQCDLDSWLTETAKSSQQKLHPTCQLGQQAPDLDGEQANTSGMVGDNGLDMHTSEASSATVLHPNVLWESSADSARWFDNLDLADAGNSSAGKAVEGRSDRFRRAPCWGPSPPPQYPAMLRGELAVAVTSGVAGKSLMKEVQSLHDCRQLILTL